MTKRVHVSLVGIKNVHTGDDPGSNLEIYGDLFARQVIVNDIGEFQALVTKTLWHKRGSDAIEISEGAIFPISAMAEVFIEPGQFLWIGGHLAERDDTNPNDNLGFIDKKIPHDTISSGPHVIVYQESDQVVEARFSLSVA